MIVDIGGDVSLIDSRHDEIEGRSLEIEGMVVLITREMMKSYSMIRCLLKIRRDSE